MKCIIPAAGFGTRVGTSPNKSKEMLPDANNYGKPLIQWALDLCKLFKMEPHVILRKEKTDLYQYLFDNAIKTQVIEVEGEWNSTVLKSLPFWSENNLLLLPDTRFSSLRCVEDIQRGLDVGNNAVMALHEVTDPDKWGIVKDYILREKPKNLSGKEMAWGLIGFKESYGHELFTKIKSIQLQNVGFTYFDKFEDLTRGPK